MPEPLSVNIQRLQKLTEKFRNNPIDTTSEALAALDEADGTVDKKIGNVDAFLTAVQAELGSYPGTDKPDLEKMLTQLGKVKTSAPDSLKVKVNNKDFDLSTQELIQKPFTSTTNKEQTLWLNEIHKTANKGVVLDKARATATVATIVGRRNISDDAVMEDVVQKLWDNDDSIGGEKRKIFRMEEILGMHEAIKTLPADKQQAALALFGKKMGEYIHKNFGDNAQFTMDTFIALHQSTDWGKGGHTPELQNFYKSMLGEMCQNVPHLKAKIDALPEGEAVVLGNYDVDGGPFGSSAFYVRKENGNLSFDFIEHIKAPEGSKAIGVDPKTVGDSIASVVKEVSNNVKDKKLTLTEPQKKALEALEKTPNIPAILSGEKGGLEALFGQLKDLAGITNLDPAIKLKLSELIEQVGKLLGKSVKEIEEAKGPTAPPSGGAAPGPAGSGTPSPVPPTGTPPAGTPPTGTPPVSGDVDIPKLKIDLQANLQTINQILPMQADELQAINKLINSIGNKDFDPQPLIDKLEGFRSNLDEGDLTAFLDQATVQLKKLKPAAAPPVPPPSPAPTPTPLPPPS